jgi:Rap1a immunity proteins
MEEFMRVGFGVTIITVSVCLAGTAAKATEDVNADDWAATCESGGYFDRGVCAGAVANFIDGMNDYQRHGAHRLICWRPDPPKSADPDTYYDYAMVAVRYLRANPSYAKIPAPALMLAAFMRKWPCGQVGPLPK